MYLKLFGCSIYQCLLETAWWTDVAFLSFLLLICNRLTPKGFLTNVRFWASFSSYAIKFFAYCLEFFQDIVHPCCHIKLVCLALILSELVKCRILSGQCVLISSNFRKLGFCFANELPCFLGCSLVLSSGGVVWGTYCKPNEVQRSISFHFSNHHMIFKFIRN